MEPVPISAVDPALVSRVATDASQHFQLDGSPALRRAWEIRNPYSTVFKLEMSLGDWSRCFFAKLARDSQAATERVRGQLQVEFDVLTRLASVTVGPPLATTVEALAFYPDLPCVVTIEAQGWTMRKVYARQARVLTSPANRLRLRELSRLCGRWLAEFHQVTATGTGDIRIAELLDYCQIRLDRLLEQHPGVLSSAQIQAIKHAARVMAAGVAPGSLRMAGRHNDFASHNIIATADGGIQVLDFQSFDHGACTFDVCNFWFELELLKFDPSYSAELLSQMQREFLRAYGSIDIGQPGFQLARLRYAINRLLNELDGVRGVWRWSPRWRLCVSGTRRWLLAFAAGRPATSAAGPVFSD